VVGEGAQVEHSVLMAGVELEAGAMVRNSVVLPGARVGAGALVDGSIVGARSSIGGASRLTALTVVGNDSEVPEGASLDGARVPDEEHS
jgi:ADP-glucose pyrophosphorylase